MFDVNFSEIMVVLVVALVVIGPERLPKVARTLGHLWGRGQRYINGIKADIERDMSVADFRKLQQDIQAEASAVGESIKQSTLTVEQQLQAINERIAQINVEAVSKAKVAEAAASETELAKPLTAVAVAGPVEEIITPETETADESAEDAANDEPVRLTLEQSAIMPAFATHSTLKSSIEHSSELPKSK
jgi:sec-independent protein translocase protein TatB